MGQKSRGNFPINFGEIKRNIMSNEDRIKMGLEPDPELEEEI